MSELLHKVGFPTGTLGNLFAVLIVGNGTNGAVVTVPDLQFIFPRLIDLLGAQHQFCVDLRINPAVKMQAAFGSFLGVVACNTVDANAHAGRNFCIHQRNVGNGSLQGNANIQSRFHSNGEMGLVEVGMRNTELTMIIFHTRFKVRTIADGNGAVQLNIRADGYLTKRANGVCTQNQRSLVHMVGELCTKADRACDKGVTRNLNNGIHCPQSGTLHLPMELHVGQVNSNLYAFNGFGQMNFLDLGGIANQTNVAIFSTVIHDIDRFQTFCNLKVTKVTDFGAFRINADQIFTCIQLGNRHSVQPVVGSHRFRAIHKGNTVKIYRKQFTLIDCVHTRNCQCPVIIHLCSCSFQHLHFIGEDKAAFVFFVNNRLPQNGLCICQHGSHFRFGNRLFGLKRTVYQCQPFAVNRNLCVICVGHFRTVGEGIAYALFQLEAQTEVQGMRRKITSDRIIGSERQTCFQFHHTEFHRNQNVTVVFFLACQVTKIVIGVVVGFYRHFKSSNQLLYPLAACHFSLFVNRKSSQGQSRRQQCCHHSQQKQP